MSVVNIFRALGEPTRLKMVERLSGEGMQTISSLSKNMNISRQGARKHLQILADAEIITFINKGRSTGVQLDQKSLETGKKFIAKIELKWQSRLERLRVFVEKK